MSLRIAYGPKQLCDECQGKGWELCEDGWTVSTCFFCSGDRVMSVYPIHDCKLDGHSFGHSQYCHYCDFDAEAPT